MRLRVVFAALLAGAAMASAASISGVVRDRVNRQPLENYVVSTAAHNPYRDVHVTTDRSGKYTLSDLPPGKYEIETREAERFLPQLTRTITLGGQDLSDVNLDVPVDGVIRGRVLDENKEPVAGVYVSLIAREYYLGAAGYYFAGAGTGAQTNDRGQYSIANVPAGRGFLLMVFPPAGKLPAHSETPLNPNFRRRVPMRTWYPNSPDREGAMPLVLKPGEHRDGTDIEVRRSANYCVDGATIGPNGPMAMQFSLEARAPASGSNSTGGTYVNHPSGTTGADGKLRVCDLSPGTYRVEVQTATKQGDGVTHFGATELLIQDEDLHGMRFSASAGRTLDVEVVWDPPSSDPVPAARLRMSMQATLRTGFPGTADWDELKTAIPGTLSFPNLFYDEYHAEPRIDGKGLYIKDVTYAGRSVQHEPLRYGSAMEGAGLRVSVGRDGGTIAARVADKDGNPVADSHVTLFPVDAGSEGLLAATMTTGQTDQLGQYTSDTLAPGTYYVLASEEEFDASLESVGKLWRARTSLQQVELAPNGSAQVSLLPVAVK